MTTHLHTLLLVGCGKMGSALLERWKQNFPATQFHIIDPHHTATNEPNVSWHRNLEALPQNINPTVIVLAVKPQQLADILPPYRKRFAKTSPLYLSIAAGKTLAFYAEHLGDHAHIVRAMPNTPALVGQGITALCSSPTLPAAAKKTSMDLLQAVGKVEWLDSESLMDAVTAISGCGPAYVFLFLESLVQAGIACRLSEAMAKSLAVQTVYGSLQLSEHSGKSYEQLRTEVASPGGATEAALKVLTANDAFKALVETAVLTAKKRSEELSS